MVRKLNKKSRFLSTKENNKLLKNKKGPNGYRLCRWCETEVEPPRRTFCSEKCVHEWSLRSNNRYLREYIYRYQRGICSLCGLDTRLLRIKIEDKIADLLGKYGEGWEKSQDWVSFLKNIKYTHKESGISLWHADHIKPVSDGGGMCGPENFRTLCVPCHKEITKTWRKNRKS